MQPATHFPLRSTDTITILDRNIVRAGMISRAHDILI
jgi:hypothetical protein